MSRDQHSFPHCGFIEAASAFWMVALVGAVGAVLLSALCCFSGGADKANSFGCLLIRPSLYNVENYDSGEDFIILTIPFAAGEVSVALWDGFRTEVSEGFVRLVTSLDGTQWMVAVLFFLVAYFFLFSCFPCNVFSFFFEGII
jgi:hypothetical protein